MQICDVPRVARLRPCGRHGGVPVSGVALAAAGEHRHIHLEREAALCLALTPALKLLPSTRFLSTTAPELSIGCDAVLSRIRGNAAMSITRPAACAGRSSV